MGSISLMVVPHDESDFPILRDDTNRRRNELARSRMQGDPAFAKKIARILAE
jgi:hypothetical protein